MAKEQPKWKKISKGEKLPCWGFLMRMDGTITNVTAMGTTIGQDAYYLPSDSLLDTIKDFPKEESEDERIIKNIKKVIGWYRGMFTEKSLMPEEYQEIDAWLEKQGEQKTTWSEEDEENKKTLRFLAYENCDAEDASRLITWLENLKVKEQILHLQAVYEKPAELWKPTKEQIKALDYLIRCLGESGTVTAYDSNLHCATALLQDLKKMIDDR